MINLPQTRAADITATLNALIDESDRFRDWNNHQIRALVRELEKLQKVDAKAAFVLFGSLAAICGKVDDVFDSFRKALRLPGEPDAEHEFWTSLGNIGLHSKSSEYGSSLLEPKRGFFPTIWRKAVSRGQLREVWNRLPEAMKTYPDLSKEDFSTLERSIAVMEEHDLSDEDIISVLDLMGEIQRAQGIMFSGRLVSTLQVVRPPDDAPYLYLTIQLDASVSEIHAMNRELARLVVEKCRDGAFPQGVVASFTKVETKDLRAAA